MQPLVPLLILLAILALPIAWFSLTFLIASFEVYSVWPFEPTKEVTSNPVSAKQQASEDVNPYAVGAFVPEDSLLNNYGEQACKQADACGFRHLGVFRDTRGTLYRLRYDFFISPSSEILLMIGCGTIAKIPLNATWMFTLLSDGRCLLTIDNPAGTHHDLTGMTEERVYSAATFEKVLAHHESRIKSKSLLVRPFSNVDPLSDLKAFRIRRAESLVDLHYAHFREPARLTWRYSLWGAMYVTVFMYWSQLRGPGKD